MKYNYDNEKKQKDATFLCIVAIVCEVVGFILSCIRVAGLVLSLLGLVLSIIALVCGGKKALCIISIIIAIAASGFNIVVMTNSVDFLSNALGSTETTEDILGNEYASLNTNN